MFIKSMKISNFQCFSEVPVDIDFEKDITCLIGNNGAGKTSILKAIQKVFGNTTDERTIFKSDFHVATGETDLQNRQLYIDIVFEFLDKDEVKTLAFFSPVIYESKNKTFQARMRLEALWNEDEYEDDVSSTLFWVLTDEDVDFGDETPLKIKVENHERRQINLIYVPATRNAKSILNIELKRIIKKIERYADISETDRLAIENDSKVLGEKVNAITAVQSIQTAINNVWNKIHDSSLPHYGNIKLEIISNKFEDLVKSLILKLFPSETEDLKDINELSDGQISLLYLTLSMALHEIEVQHENNKLSGLKEQDYDAPIFTIFALEEPENHLAKLHAKYFDKKYFANRALSLLHLMFNLMETWGYRPKHSNPCDGIKKYKENARIRYLSKKELKLFFKEITHIEKNKPNSLYALSAIKLLFLTGARKNEILTCKWEYVDFEKHLIFLPDSKTGTKIIYLNTKAIKILKKLYNKPEREYSPYIIKNQLFTGHIVHIEHIWKMILKNSRIIDFRIHDIRHTVASHLISTGHNLSDVACILGHKSIMMSQKYAHLSSERAMNTCEAVSKIVKRSILADIF